MSFDGLDIVAALMDAHDRADELCADLKAAGAARAEAERAYRVGKRKGIVFEREHHGSPASLTIDLVKGREDIAELALRRDLAVSEYEATREALLVKKKEIDTLRELYTREWSASGQRG